MLKYTDPCTENRRKIQTLTFTLVFLLSISIIFCSCTVENIVTAENDAQKLLLTLSDSDPVTTSLDANNLGYSNSITFHNIPDLLIEIDDEEFRLIDAIQNNLITVEEIIAFARIDARNGKNMEVYESTNGLSRFIYRYSDYDLIYVHDVYETPDGKEHLISNISFCQSGQYHTINTYYYDEEHKYLIDREDWGIRFTIEESSSEKLTLCCTQSGGQQFGNLAIMDYSIYFADDEEWVISSAAYTPNEFAYESFISKDDTSILTIDWSTIYDKLPSGDYTLMLRITDIYDEANLHPLLNNFHDTQIYYIDFHIK